MTRSLILLSSLVYAVVSSDLQGPLTSDFQDWLNKNGYGADNFQRSDYVTQGSYGGKSSVAPNSTQTPIIFIHGNSDSALKTEGIASGWGNTIDYFLGKGYTSADLYATSWGDNIAMNANTRTHDCKTVLRLRRFVEAVLKYTGANQVSLITHSMGVTLGRKIIKGGQLTALDGSCNVGSPLTAKVDVFLGISGANYGLCNCEASGTLMATCNKQNGFWPGDSCGFNLYTCGLAKLMYPCPNGPTYSSFLTELNSDNTREGAYVYSVWSSSDDLIMYGDMVWGRPTSFIARSTKTKTYPLLTHMQTKELTFADQYEMVVNKNLN